MWSKSKKLLSSHRFKNGVTNQGLDRILDVMFHGTTQITTWFMGLIDASGYSALAAADVMNSHAGWTELQNYSESTRPPWNEAASSGQAMTNATVTVFTMNATKTVKGLFLASNNTKGGTTGTLWCTGLLLADVLVESGNELTLTYTVGASST